MSHLTTIINRIKHAEEMYKDDFKGMTKDLMFQQAVANLKEYQDAWTDQTQEEVIEADRLYSLYGQYERK